MSPDISDKPFLTSWRKPDETETAMIITRKLTAIEITAIFPLKRSLPAMKKDASILWSNYSLPSWPDTSSPALHSSYALLQEAHSELPSYRQDASSRPYYNILKRSYNHA